MSENETNLEATATETVEATQTDGRGRKRVSDVAFMTTWETVVFELGHGTVEGRGAEIVAERTGLKPSTVTQRAGKMRKEGVALSHMPRAKNEAPDVVSLADELAKVRERLRNQGETSE